MEFLLDAMLKDDAEGRISGDEVSRFLRHVATGRNEVFDHNHSFLLGKRNGFLRSAGNW